MESCATESALNDTYPGATLSPDSMRAGEPSRSFLTDLR
jgi:hypothetical protein